MMDTAKSKGGYVLVVEGAVSTRDDGVYCQFGEEGGRDVSDLEWTRNLGRDALAVIALGTCAVGGGIPAGVAVARYAKGLGYVSNMSDGRAWGLWIPFDLYCGVPLAAGGFTMAAIVYILNNKKYLPLARPAILTAFLGYLMVVFALLVDLGQPWYIFKMIWNPNIHSPLYEVGWCVLLYNIVLFLEFLPAVFEKLKWNIPLRALHLIEIPLIIAGIVISTGHQNSLGSMLLLMGNDLHYLYYTPILPLLFFLHAVAVGPAMVLFETTISSQVFGHQIQLDTLAGVGKLLRIPLFLYLCFRVGDIIVAGELRGLFNEFPTAIWLWIELIVGGVLPLILFSLPAIQKSRRGLFVTAIMLANRYLPIMKLDEGHGHGEQPAEAPAAG